MEDKFETIDAEFKDEDRNGVIAFGQSIFKLSDFMRDVKEAFHYKGLDELAAKLSNRGGIPVWKDNRHLWFNQGIVTEVLKPNAKGWRKGKIRIKVILEFCPDEPELKETEAINTETESPLDDLRRMISE
ncbi:hypothetical protein NOS3756_35120 [Nostoc sp. NIES-3756]|uniref:KGK domain-containing protein n=1 Tax=Nostoc sp. NIES-3756 TaxID=1751286 RepID=UPI00071F3B29|nr:KGK domain-containing protein [Nostoc sp. NIES-3756]BAT54541.1 hypothetical protein NOS3756_35120 [Nostoc sp. NIES-3756]